MISKKYSHNFRQMFLKSVRQTIIMPILMLVTGLINIFAVSVCDYYLSDKTDKYPFFFDILRTDFGFLNFFVVLFAIITAIRLFKFQWSKRESNVIFSLGMKRSEIFNAKILGGIVPTAAVAVIVSIIEIICNIIAGKILYTIFWKVAIFMIVSWLAVYIFSFVICSVVFSCSGNALEACFYTLLVFFLPTVVYCIFRYMQYGHVLGYSFDAPLNVRFDLPFIQHYVYNNIGTPISSAPDFSKLTYSEPTCFSDYSSTVFALIYSVLAYVLGLLEFKKHKVEIAGTWGRSKVMTGICSIANGLVCFLLMNMFCSDVIPTTSSILHFVLCCTAFLIGVVLFKLIFTIRRKQELKRGLKQYPICVAALGLISLVFAFGFFGYSSYVPEAGQVKNVSVEMELYNYREDLISGPSMYALFTPEIGMRETDIFRGQLRGKYYDADAEYDDYYYTKNECRVAFIKRQDIADVINVHQALVDDGRIDKRSDNAYFLPINIKYTLEDNSVVYRHYYTTTRETAKKILALSDTHSAKNALKSILDAQDSNNWTAIERDLGEHLRKEIRIDNFMVYDFEHEKPIGEIHARSSTTLVYFDYSTLEEFEFAVDYFSSDFRVSMLGATECYLFGKDMTNGYKIGIVDEELIDALKADMLSQTSSDYYFHSLEDELGVISFEPSDINSMDANYESFEESEDDSLDSWNLFSSNVTTFVVTKSMTNTLKYLESKDLLKYFESTKKTSDIKSIKLATADELYGDNRQYIYPIFCAGYCTADNVKSTDESYADVYYEDLMEHDHPFIKINNQITDAAKIQKLMNSSLLFGYCNNDSRIMEIQYNDGSIGTRLISAEVYNSIK